MIPNYQIRLQARDKLRGNWGNAVIVSLIFYGILTAVGWITEDSFFSVINFLIMTPLSYGLSLLFLTLIRKNDFNIELLFGGFSEKYLKIVGIGFFTSLFIFLWSLLLIIPGIVASYSYSMVYFILVDEPDIDIFEAIAKSKKMMYGNKGQLFLLDLSFLGWCLLSLLSFGIGFLWLFPYVTTSHTLFYERIKKGSGYEGNSNYKNETNNDREETELKLEKGEQIIHKL